MKFSSIDVPAKDLKALESLKAAVDSALDGPCHTGTEDNAIDIEAAVEKFIYKKQEVAEAGQQAVSRAITEFMAAHEEVEAIRFTLDANHWDDEEYSFRIGEPRIKLVGGDIEPGDYGDGFLYSYELDDAKKGLESDIDSMERFFKTHEAVMRATFGGSSVVTVGRDGVATVEGYAGD